MLSFAGSLKVFVAVEPCDMRKGFNGLYAAVTARDGKCIRLFSGGFIDRLLRLQNARGHFFVIGLVTRMHVGLHNGARVQIHHHLRLIDHVGGAVFGPADLGIRIMRVHQSRPMVSVTRLKMREKLKEFGLHPKQENEAE